jgi:hypothetical protein
VFILKIFQPRNRNQSSVAPSLQIFDLLQWSRSEKEWREECRAAIIHHRVWKRSDPKNMAPSLLMYSFIRGQLLRQHARDVIRYYRLVRRNRRELFSHYLKTLPPVRA